MNTHKEITVNQEINTTYEYMDEASVDPELICNICHSPLKDPYCTPCSETFCRECITNWIQTQNTSCPHCRQAISINALTQAPRSLRNMLDRLLVKCILCQQTELKRVNFDEHTQKACPKTVVLCPSADIKCPWTGQRDQLEQHLATCRFEPMRPVIIEFIVENQQLKDRLNQEITSDREHLKEIQRLREQVAQSRVQTNADEHKAAQQKVLVENLQRQVTDAQREKERMNDQVVQLRQQINTHLREIQRLKEQLQQRDAQVTSMNRQSSIQAAAATNNILVTSNGVEGLIGSWDYLDGENFDNYMKEIGVGFATRTLAKLVKPRITISQNGDKWTIRAESTLKIVSYDFTPSVQFDETTPDGREVTSVISFEGDKWVHTSTDKSGKKSVVTRYIDDKGQHMIEMKSGSVKARGWYNRVESNIL